MDSIVSQQSSVSWSEVLPQDWIQESRSVSDRGLIVTHEFQPAGEVDAPNGGAEHVLCFSFNSNIRQVTRIDGQEYDGANQIGSTFLIPSQASAFCYWECERPDEVVSFYIDPQRLQQVAAENDCLYPERTELRPILEVQDHQLTAIATAFRSEMYSNNFGGKLYTESLANLFLVHLLRNYCTQTLTLRSYDSGLSYQQLQQAIDFMQNHLGDEFSIQDIANLLGISQYYFCRLFKQSMGPSPYQYVLQQRVEFAKRLLKQRDKSIAQVALESGFSSQSHLTQHFRKLTGTTPKAYRKS
ncbi:helix-turn-helix transcriptional regulator [Pseudanabaenaceae cyanobacterium LEGE 13415]|nr:helix-turn-helix transcriptional regulator [Pseudanabaenaceae cyanobacterium LEGE 13415]